jgi:hypothetical protein
MHSRNIPSSTRIPLEDAQERATISRVLPPLDIYASLSLSPSFLSPLLSRLSNHHGGLRITNELRQEVKGRSGQHDSQA